MTWPPGRGPVTRFGGNPATEASAVTAMTTAAQEGQRKVAAQLETLQRRLDAAPDDPGLAFRTARSRQMLAAVGQVEQELLTAGREFAYREVPALYAEGRQQLLSELGDTAARLAWTTADYQAASVIARDTFSDLASATTYMADTAKDTIRQVGRQVQGVRTLTGGTLEQASATMAKSLRAGGVLGFVDRAGHGWTLDAYTRMVVRTKAAQAHNTGRALAAEQAGVDRFVIIDGVNDAPCREVNGKTCDGGWAVANPLGHPNCRRVFGPDPDGTGRLDYTSGRKPSELFEGAEVDQRVADELDTHGPALPEGTVTPRDVGPLGQQVHVQGPLTDPLVQQHLGDLREIPDGWQRALVDNGTVIDVGNTTVTGFPSHAHLAGVRPRGWPEGRTWDEVPGLYDPSANRVVLGRGRHGTGSLAKHETGHALDVALGSRGRDASKTGEFVHTYGVVKEHRAAQGGRINPYYLQAGDAGREEMWAEAAGRYLAADRDAALSRLAGTTEGGAELARYFGTL